MRVQSCVPRPHRVALDDDLLVQGDNLDVLPLLPDGAFDMIYIDPPFNTGPRSAGASLRVVADPDGDRNGLRRPPLPDARRCGRRPTPTPSTTTSATSPRACASAPPARRPRHALRPPRPAREPLRQGPARRPVRPRVLPQRAHVGLRLRRRRRARAGRPSTTRSSSTSRTPTRYYFDDAEVDRIPYMAPGLVAAREGGARQAPTDAWWHTIVPTNGREQTGYPTQKPQGVVRRIVAASSRPGGWCLDFFAGSGTLGAVARALGPALRARRLPSRCDRRRGRRLAGDAHQTLPAPGV